MRHPVLGPIACVIARRRIARGEEVLFSSLVYHQQCIAAQLLVDYGYDLERAAMWYRKDYLGALQKKKQKSLN